MIQLYASLIPILFVFLVARWSRFRFRDTSAVVTHRDIPSIFHLLSPAHSTAQNLLASRATPNARLIRAFALTNTFVSPDINVHSSFVGHANTLLRAATQRGWAHFQQTAMGAVQAVLVLEASQVDFDILVQDITMRAVLVGLLVADKEVDEFESTDIRVVSSLITRLWRMSKSSDHIPADLLPQLNRHLRRLIADDEKYPNPLDYVIPVWETLWRVVATTVAYAQIQGSTDIFTELHQRPTLDQFRAFTDDRPSAEAFVTEAMRLHPPSKRIARAVPRINPIASLLHRFIGKRVWTSVTLHRECADIGSLLRDSDIWGSDAFRFDPFRYHPTRLHPRQEKLRLLPFGCGRHRCVATVWAPMAAGVISAAVLDRVGTEKEYYLVVGETIGGREGWKGWECVKC